MNAPSADACIARQPIVDAQGNLYAYELLFRSCLTKNSEHTDAVQAAGRIPLGDLKDYLAAQGVAVRPVGKGERA